MFTAAFRCLHLFLLSWHASIPVSTVKQQSTASSPDFAHPNYIRFLERFLKFSLDPDTVMKAARAETMAARKRANHSRRRYLAAHVDATHSARQDPYVKYRAYEAGGALEDPGPSY